jgi:hypothetical protein
MRKEISLYNIANKKILRCIKMIFWRYKTMNKLLKNAVYSMNYLFLKEAFSFSEQDKETRVNRYLSNELAVFLTNLSNSWNEELEEIISLELTEGSILNDFSIEDIEGRLKDSINYILGYEDDALLKNYMRLVEKLSVRQEKNYYKIPVTWSVGATIQVEADSLEKAIEKVRNGQYTDKEIINKEYMHDSFCVEHEFIEC